jgi:hypothetical protein
MNKYFTIKVMGKEPSQAEEGYLNTTTGAPDGRTSKIKLQVGAVQIPNFSKVWAEVIVDSKTKVPTGELKFLKWGDKAGRLVSIRYIQGQPSLDKNYQKNVLKVDLSPEEETMNAYINLDIGINDFDVARADPMFIEFLQHHTYNGSNISRDPNSREIHFEIYDAKKINTGELDRMREKRKAEDIVFAAEGDSAILMILAKMFDIDPQAQDEVIFSELLEKLGDNYKNILTVVNDAKARFEVQLKSLFDQRILVEGPDGEIFDKSDSTTSDFLIKDIKDTDKIAYLVANILEPEVHPAYTRVLEITEQQLELLQ